jgi:hypothetical protein
VGDDSESKEPTASEKAVQEQLGEVSSDPVARATEDARPHASLDAAERAMEDPADHEAVPFDNEASNPASSGPEGLEGDWGVSSESTTAQHPRTDGITDVSPGTYDGTDVSQPDFAGHEGQAPEQQDDDNRMWDQGRLATSGEPKPAPIQDEKNRREGEEPPSR